MTAIRQYAASGRGGGTLTLPSAPIAGNRIVFAVGARSANIGVGQIPTIGEYTQHGTLWTGQNGVDVYSKISDGSEAGDLAGIGNQAAGVFIELDGPFALRGILTGTATGGGHPVAGPVDAEAGDFGLAITVQGHGGAWDSGAGGITYTPDAGWTEILDAYVSGGGHPNTWVGYQDVASDGPISGGATCSATPDFGVGTFTWGAIVAVFEGNPPPIVPGPQLGVYDPDDVFIGDLTDAFDVKLRIELNGTGTGQFSVNRYSPDATAALLTPGNYVRVTIPQIDPDPIFGFFLESGDFGLVSKQEAGGENVSFIGRGGLAYWERAIWLAESFLIPEWWPAHLPDPDPEDIGALVVPAGRYRHYVVSGTTYTSFTREYTGGFSAYYDRRRKYTPAGAMVTAGEPARWLVRLSSGAYSGEYLSPFEGSIRDYRKKSPYTEGPSVLMSSVSPDSMPGEVIYQMYQEAIHADRPVHPLAGMTIDFTDAVDSDGSAWNATDALQAVSAQLGDDYLSTIAQLVNTGAVEVVMGPDLDMHAYNVFGRAKQNATFAAGKVRFVKGVNIADELKRQYTDTPIGTWAEVIGNIQGAVAQVDLPSAGARPPREISVRGDTADTVALEQLGLAELEARQLHSDATGFAVDTPIIGLEDELTGKYLPGPPGSARGDYWVGDTVSVHTGSGEHDFNNATLRIHAISMEFSEAGDLRAVVEVNSSLGGLTPPRRQGVGAAGRSPGAGFTSGSFGDLSDSYVPLTDRGAVDGVATLGPDGLIPSDQFGTAWKQPVRFATTGPVTLASGFENGDTHDGVTLVTGDPFLNKDAADASENGIYFVNATGAPTRRPDSDSGADVYGAIVMVREGTVNAGKVFWNTNANEPVVGTDDLTYEEFATAETLDDLTDVVITAPVAADRLRYDGTVWRNSSLKWKPVLALDPTTGLYVNVHSGGDPVMAEG